MAQEQYNINKCIVCGNAVANCSKIYSVPTSKDDDNTTFNYSTMQTWLCSAGHLHTLNHYCTLHSQDTD